jgi:hypothetical protein
VPVLYIAYRHWKDDRKRGEEDLAMKERSGTMEAYQVGKD